MCIYESNMVDPVSRLTRYVIQSPTSIYQSYAGIHEFDTVIRIIEGYEPSNVVVSCANMHAKTIVRFMHALIRMGYKVTIKKTIILNYPFTFRTIFLDCTKSWDTYKKNRKKHFKILPAIGGLISTFWMNWIINEFASITLNFKWLIMPQGHGTDSTDIVVAV